MVEHGGRAIGCTVIPGGIGQTEMQVATIRDLRASAFAAAMSRWMPWSAGKGRRGADAGARRGPGSRG